MATVYGTLQVTGGPLAGQSFEITSETTRIGRSATGNDIILNDPSVSRTHAVLTYQSGHPYLANASQTNQLLVNGVPQLHTELPDTATIQLGTTTLQWTNLQTTAEKIQTMPDAGDTLPPRGLGGTTVPPPPSPPQFPYGNRPGAPPAGQPYPPAQPPPYPGKPPAPGQGYPPAAQQPYPPPAQQPPYGNRPGAPPAGQPYPPAQQPPYGNRFGQMPPAGQPYPPPGQQPPPYPGRQPNQPYPPQAGPAGQPRQPGPSDEPHMPGMMTMAGFDASQGGITMQFALPGQMNKTLRVLLLIGIIGIVGICGILAAFDSLAGIPRILSRYGLGYGFVLAVLILLIPMIPAGGVFLLTNFIDRFEAEPWVLRIGAFIWGAVIAIPPAATINTAVHKFAVSLGPVAELAFFGIDPGIVEEGFKGLGLIVLLIFIRDEFDDVLDGMVYGALIGAGFAMTENFVYFSRAVLRGGFVGLVLIIVIRIILGWLNHATFTSFFGAGLGILRTTRNPYIKYPAPVIGFLMAAGLHNMFDFLATLLGGLLSGLGGFIITILILTLLIIFAQVVLFALVIFTVNKESKVIAAIMAPELRAGIITAEEYALLPRSFKRTAAERKILFTYGWKAFQLAKELYQTEIGLAFRKWHVSLGDKRKAGRRQPEDAYRMRIFYLRGQLQREMAQKAKRPQQSQPPAYSR